jgi:hypothetical protein
MPESGQRGNLMAYMGRGEYALLLHLSEHGSQPLIVNGNKTTVGNAEFRTAVVNGLVDGGLATRTGSGDGATELELSATGRDELDRALAQKWVVDHSGLHEESQTYRFEVPDPVTGRRFVVAVSQEAGANLAHRVAYSVIAAPSVRESCRGLEAIGPESAFHVEVAVEGAGDIAIWRKL